MAKIDGRTVRSAQTRARMKRSWTAAKRQRFLQALAETCNVQAAARAADVGAGTAYHMRLRDGEFAQLWAAAMETGYVRLEAALLERALGAPQPGNPVLDEIMPRENAEPAALDVDLALKLLARRADAGVKAPRKGGRPLRQPTPDEIHKALERKITAIERRLEAGR